MAKQRRYAVSVLMEKPEGWCSGTICSRLSIEHATTEDEARGIATGDALKDHPDFAVRGVTALRIPRDSP